MGLSRRSSNAALSITGIYNTLSGASAIDINKIKNTLNISGFYFSGIYDYVSYGDDEVGVYDGGSDPVDINEVLSYLGVKIGDAGTGLQINDTLDAGTDN